MIRPTAARVAIGALTVSMAGFVAILSREDIKTEAYADPVHGWKVPTIGAGSTEGVKQGDRVTPLQAVQRAEREIRTKESAIKRCVNVPLHQHEYDAYLRLAHNIGTGAFCGSTLVRRLNAGDYAGACDAVLMWRRAGTQDCSAPGNRVCPGLWRDRLATHAQCRGG